MNLLVESQYFSPAILFKISINFSNIKFDEYEPYRKMSFRNRCVVAGSNGPVILSIPLVDGRDQRKPMKEVLIDNKKAWQVQHWRTIVSCYNRSPWFDYYGHELEEIYRQRFGLLVDWNRTCLEWVAGKIELPGMAKFSAGKELAGEPKNYEDYRNRLLPRSIEKDFPNPVRYRQVFEERTGFMPHLSILDLLFCEGKNTRRILSESQ